MSNPFQYGAELKPAQIVNRKQEIRDVTRTITEHGRVFLLGPPSGRGRSREERKDSIRWRLEDPFFSAWLKA